MQPEKVVGKKRYATGGRIAGRDANISFVPEMVWIPGGEFLMGSDHHYPEEAPQHRVTVDSFWIDRTPVTNRRFHDFVRDTGHITFAEILPDPADYPGALPEMLYAGSLVFVKSPARIDPRQGGDWWQYRRGANWRHPSGPESTLAGREDHPVVHIAYSDAIAFARWENKSLPTEAEWEFAARGGLEGAEYAWGRELCPGGKAMANIWEGEFPWQSTREDGCQGTSPVEAYPPNGYGLFDMIGNVWEWTSDWFNSRQRSARPCCMPRNPRGAMEEDSYDPRMPQIRVPRKVLKGGSHLCATNYCRRYRPAARFPQPVDTSTCHLGFRCVVRPRAVSAQ